MIVGILSVHHIPFIFFNNLLLFGGAKYSFVCELLSLKLPISISLVKCSILTEMTKTLSPIGTMIQHH